MLKVTERLFFVAGGHGSVLCTVVMLECRVSGLPGPPQVRLEKALMALDSGYLR